LQICCFSCNLYFVYAVLGSQVLLFSVQFPFADLRKFIGNTGQLEYPVWPLPTPDTEFVRYFGSIRIRRRGGVEGWVGENEICEAGNALRFSTGLKFTASNSDVSFLLRCAFKRLYFDGKRLVNMKLVFALKSVLL
jgi:hypothetical protein